MSWRTEKTKLGQDLVWDGVETGIALSPTKGTANIQNANINTELGEIMASYARIKQNQIALTSQTLTAVDSTLFSGPATLQAGQWVTVSSTTIASNVVSYLVVAGGGGGGGGQDSPSGNGGGGGGGAGGMLTGTTVSLGVLGSYTITVGAAGTAGTAGTAGGVLPSAGGNGSNSSIAALVVSTGGGGGAAGNADPGNTGANGGSGGGGAGGQIGGTATIGQGNNGGNGIFTGGSGGGGGGGGAGAVGQNGNTSGGISGGNGGNGLASNISGASVTYAGGGGGASPGGFGTGGTGGGGAGNSPGVAGTTNLGGGGGGGAQNNAGGAGGKGIVILSYTTGTMTATGGTITTSGGNTIHTFTSTGTFTVTVPMFTTGTYYVSYKNSSNQVKLSAVYDPEDLYPVPHGASGTATFSVATIMSAPIAKATEQFNTGSTTEYRYYILDYEGYVWIYDTKYYADTLAADGVGIKWFLPDNTDYGSYVLSGMAILNGWLHVTGQIHIYVKQTVNLGAAFTQFVGQAMNSAIDSNIKHFAYVGHQGKMFYCDGNYLGEIFPTTSLETSIQNIQTYAKYTASTTTGTMTAVISGGTPSDGAGTRIPAVFFTDALGTQPTNLTAGTVYYIQNALGSADFQVYAASSGGAALNIQTGAAGNQYFNTYYPIGTDASATGTNPLVTISLQRVNLPIFEIATCMIEISNTILIGGITNTLYSWNQISARPSDLIALPESGAIAMTNVNNMAYVLAGNKGNIYISNGSVASVVTKIPDYCAGVPGTPLTYIEPIFTWGDIAYMRGRVYVSILDQTATKAGNCGGVWSFIPAQNFYTGQDTGLAMRLENQNSYGNYSGMATLIIPSEEQDAVSPQYWAGWQNSYSVATSTNFGVDFTDTVPVTLYVFETDLFPTGTFLNQETFDHVEYKLTTPLVSGDSMQLYYRLNATDAWTSCGTVVEETANPLSGYFPVNFQKTQWLQLRAQVTLNGTTTSSFGRFKQLRVR